MVEESRIAFSDRLLRLPEVKTRVGMSRSTIYRYVNDGLFPRPRRLGLAAIAWNESDIVHWIANRPST